MVYLEGEDSGRNRSVGSSGWIHWLYGERNRRKLTAIKPYIDHLGHNLVPRCGVFDGLPDSSYKAFKVGDVALVLINFAYDLAKDAPYGHFGPGVSGDLSVIHI